jgi:hypothetical protein
LGPAILFVFADVQILVNLVSAAFSSFDRGKSLICVGKSLFLTVMTTILRRRFQPRAHLAAIALLSFMVAFAAARVFTTFFPSAVLIGNGIHIHHFWFGIALLAVGGWLGISYNDKDTDRLAAILYGAGGGLIVDEVGLLLTFGE